MKRIVVLIVCVLLAIGLIATLNDGEYIGLTGVLQRLSKIDFSFSNTINAVVSAFETFENVGTSSDVLQAVKLAIDGLVALLKTPFVAIMELIQLIRDIFDLLFALVGVF